MLPWFERPGKRLGERHWRIKSRCRNKASRNRRQPQTGVRGGLVAATANTAMADQGQWSAGTAALRRCVTLYWMRPGRSPGRGRSGRDSGPACAGRAMKAAAKPKQPVASAPVNVQDFMSNSLSKRPWTGLLRWRSKLARVQTRQCDLCHSRAVTAVTEFTGAAMRASCALSATQNFANARSCGVVAAYVADAKNNAPAATRPGRR